MNRGDQAEAAVVSALFGSAEIAASAGARVFPVKIPLGAEFPCVTYQRSSINPYTTLRGYGSESVVMRLASFAKSYDEARELAAAARDAVTASSANAVLRSDQDGWREEEDAYSVSMEFLCTHQHGGYENG